MAELQKLLESNEAFQSVLIRDLLQQAQQSTGEQGFPGSSSSTTLPVISSSSSLPPDVNENITQTSLSLAETSPTDDNRNLGHTSFTNQAFESSSDIDNSNVARTSTGSALTQQGSDSSSTSFSSELIRQEIQSFLTVVGTAITGLDISGENENDRVTRILSKLKETPSETRKMLLEQATAAAVDAHLSTTINTHKNVLEATEKIQQKIQETPDAYARSLNSNSLWQYFLTAMLPEVAKVIKFSTKLPGFPELGQEDKTLLIRQGCFEVMAIRFCLLVDPEKEEMLDPTLQIKAPRHVVRDTPMGDFLDLFFTVASKFNPLALTDEEIGLFTAVLMLCPDREGLMNRTVVTVIHQLFLQALYLLLRKNHQDADEILRSLINIIPIVQKIKEDHLEFLKIMKQKSQTEFEKKFPTLHREIFDVAC